MFTTHWQAVLNCHLMTGFLPITTTCIDLKLKSITYTTIFTMANQPTSVQFYTLMFQPALCNHLNSNFFRFPDVSLTSADVLSVTATIFLFIFPRQSIAVTAILLNLFTSALLLNFTPWAASDRQRFRFRATLLSLSLLLITDVTQMHIT